jgi:hypothetical protein
VLLVPRLSGLALLAVFLTASWAVDAIASRKTVCTITVNSANEKQAFRRYLPRDEFEFVELMEHGRRDLASACRQGLRCDVLLVSGHFDDGTEFYSDRLEAAESLPVSELERASCSQSCSGLFSQLKEVYLFGCNTLDAGARRNATAEIERSLVRGGMGQVEAASMAAVLGDRYGESNRDRMRQVFRTAPVIYGFSAKAPLGAIAGPMLDRYFQSGGASEVGRGRPSPRLLGVFGPSSMTAATGLASTEPQADFGAAVCSLADGGSTAEQKLEFVHRFLQRDMAEVRLFLERLEQYVASLSDEDWRQPALARAASEIASDGSARTRYLEFARDADDPAVRARMLQLAQRLGWLSSDELQAALTHMVGTLIAGGPATPAQVDLACRLEADGALGAGAQSRLGLARAEDSVANAAILGCLGSAEARARTLRALTSSDDGEVEIARVYLRNRPITDPAELRLLAAGITRMDGSEAQVHALDTLAQYRLSDRETLEELARLFVRAKSVEVQRAVAGVVLRSNYQAIAEADLVHAMRVHRLKASGGDDLVDVLFRRLQSP